MSFRNIHSGSWYINALVEVFGNYYQNENVVQMMVRVNAKVNDVFIKNEYKQCPAPVFTPLLESYEKKKSGNIRSY